MTKKLTIPKLVYVPIVLFGPALLFALVTVVIRAIDRLFDLLAKFQYWWVVGLVGGYLFVGAALAGMVSTWGDGIDE